MGENSPNLVTLLTAPVSSVAGGDVTTRPRRHGNLAAQNGDFLEQECCAYLFLHKWLYFEPKLQLFLH
jgi:hypothetical protein